MNRFEDRVWEEVVITHGARLAALPVPSKTHRTRASLATGAALALVGIAVLVSFAITEGTTPPQAFAVTDNHNGTVTLTIRELTNPAAVNSKLAELGVRARVVPLQQNCTTLNMDPQYLQPTTQPWTQYPSVRGPVGSWTVVMIPGRVPIGRTLVFALRQTTRGWEMADAIVAGPAPNCSSPEYLQGLSQEPTTPPGTLMPPSGSTTTTATTP